MEDRRSQKPETTYADTEGRNKRGRELEGIFQTLLDGTNANEAIQETFSFETRWEVHDKHDTSDDKRLLNREAREGSCIT